MIQLKSVHKITQVAIQGRPDSDDYVKSYTLEYSIDGSQFTEHAQILTGNTANTGTVTSRVLPSFHGKYIRVKPRTWAGRICMRVELYGCESSGDDGG